MRKRKEFSWKPPKWLKDPVEGTALFHDKEAEVYSGTVDVEEIKLWRINNRTTLDLEHLLQELGKSDIRDLSDEQIIDYILKQGLHKIQELAGSIKKNGVRVPLTLSFNKELLDGNRRFIACKYLLKHEKTKDERFTKIPVRCLQPKIDDELILKIISEMNFLPDYKEEWPREVRAKFAVNQFENVLKKFKGNEEEAYKRVEYLLEIKKTELQTFKNVLNIISHYITYVNKNVKKAKQSAERFVRTKFHFFEEFYNKAFRGKNPIVDPKLVKETKELFFRYIMNQQLNSIIEIRDFAQVVRYDPARNHLKKPNGNFEIARSMYQDYSRPKKIGTKIIHFCEWLEGLTKEEKTQISPELKKRLLSAINNLVEK